MSRKTTVTALLALVLGLTLLAPAACSYSSTSSRTASKPNTIKAYVTYCPRDSNITIQNNDTFDWTEVVLTLNEDFTYHAATMSPGKALTVGYSAFQKDDSTAFGKTPDLLTIDCRTPNGEGYFLAVWNSTD